MHRFAATALMLATSSPAWACANAMKDGEEAGGFMAGMGGGTLLVVGGAVGVAGLAAVVGVIGAALFFFSR